MSTSYEEWRVTGQPNSYRGTDFPPYSFVWSSRSDADPEAAARAFIAGIGRHQSELGGWDDGPHLCHRTVTVTDWELRT